MIGKFLDAIWGDELGYGEIRCIRDGKVQQHFIDQFERTQAVIDIAGDYALRMSAEHWDVYFGVRPRIRKSGTKDDIAPHTTTIWADVDAKKVSDVLAVGKAGALAAINAFQIPPQILVDSGGGFHCYWRLTKPEPLARAQEVMRWIADELVGDRVQDGPRVLRVPGTFNRKREPAVMARLLRFDLDRRVRLADFEGSLPVAISEPRPRGEPMYERLRQDLPDWIVDLIERGAPQGGRSEACFKVVLWLLRYGRTPEEVRQVFESTPAGIGEKYAQKSAYDAARWFTYTITAADKVA